jgi:hypothetical protein
MKLDLPQEKIAEFCPDIRTIAMELRPRLCIRAGGLRRS